jgi:hypothetical protein
VILVYAQAQINSKDLSGTDNPKKPAHAKPKRINMAATIFTLTSVGVRIAFGSTRYFTAKQNVGRVKSFGAE